MIEERSAGIVIFRREKDKILYLLLHYPSGHWDFVKGKIEEEEEPLEAAIRESEEETGITDLKFIKKFEEKIEYHFQYDGNLIHKEVLFFLAETETQKVTLSHEHSDYTWLPYEEAYEKITYENAKRILKKANNAIS